MLLRRQLPAISKIATFYNPIFKKALFSAATRCCAVSTTQPFFFQCFYAVHAGGNVLQLAWWNHQKGFCTRTLRQTTHITAFLSCTADLKAHFKVITQPELKIRLRFTDEGLISCNINQLAALTAEPNHPNETVWAF